MNNLKEKLFKFIKLFYPLIIIIFCITLLFVVYFLVQKQSSLEVEKIFDNTDINGEISKDDDLGGDNRNIFIDKITGEGIDGDNFSYPIAIVIDNHIDAYPLFGLEDAKLVYEAPVEGGLTRFLAFYVSDQEIDKIGPVRSARGYFLDWIKPFDSLFVHCGGSPEALVRIINEDIFDFNEFFKANYFWRDKNKSAPHNVITDLYKIREYIEDNREEVSFSSWKFKEADDENKEELKEYEEDNKRDVKNPVIEIDYLIKENRVKWNYDSERGVYVRDMNEKDFNKEITAETVIIQEVETEVVDKELRLKMGTMGEGKAVICSKGECEEVKWEKNSEAERTIYYNGNREFEFNPGNFWIQIVDQEVGYSY